MTTSAPGLAAPEQRAAASKRATWLAWGLASLALLLMVGGSALTYSVGFGVGGGDLILWSFALVFGGLGGLIGPRHPRNAIGWIFAGTAISVGFGTLASSYVTYWVETEAGPELLARTAALYANISWIPWILVPSTFLVLLFPDGHLLSRRWRPVAWCAAFGMAGAFVTEGMRPGPIEDFPLLANPYGVSSGLIPLMNGLFIVLVFVCIAGAAMSLILRFRRTSGQQRQQIKWLASAGAAAAIIIPIAVASYDLLGEELANVTIMLTVLTLPAAAGIAILKYRLYDIDVVINKAVVFAVLAGFITSVYAGIVVGLGRLLPIGGGNLWLAIAATALVAVAFEPVRLRVQHWANRLVYGRRATPYETLAAMTGKIGESADPGSALNEAARLLAEGTGAALSVVWVAQEGMLVPRATAGDSGAPAPLPFEGDELPELDGTLVQAVRHEGQLVGALSLAKRPGEGVSSADRRLVEELAGQAALLLANTRLRSRLSDRLDELRTSRQRMLAAHDRARHALERNLHDGAQQELVALKVKLGLARTIATREGATIVESRLADAVSVADEAVDTLRDVARGIYPPLLESEGLAAALSAQARRGDLAVTVLDRTSTRYSRETEATAFFCVKEALANAALHASAEHAHVTLDGSDAGLTVVVTDDGAGFDPDLTPPGDGLTHMLDRADAAGGRLDIASSPGHGTTITLTLP